MGVSMSQAVNVSDLPDPAAEPRRRFQFRLVHLLVATGLIGAALALLVPMYRVAMREARQMESQNNLRQIAIALHNYHDTYSQFPPAYTLDAAGKPAHSWRVLIVPFIEKSTLLMRYNFGEPWNGPNNRKLAAKAPSYFRSPFDNSPRDKTSYVAIVGPGTMWPGESSTSLTDLTDGPSHTVMVVELINSDIHWMEPRDVRGEDVAAVWSDPKHKPPRMDDWETGYAFVAYADGSVDWLERDVALERLKALISPAGGEPVSRQRD